jgi:Holliday junction resolvasome RuvABC ATP-dependent DNA helicase subunit
MSRVVSPEAGTDDAPDTVLRPQTLAEFVGQAQARDNLRVFIDAARGRKEALIMCCSSGRRGSARRRWRKSWRASSA